MNVDPVGEFAIAVGGAIAVLSVIAKAAGITALIGVSAFTGTVIGKKLMRHGAKKKRKSHMEKSSNIYTT